MSKALLKESFEVESKHGAYYTGGNIKWSNDGEHLFCQKGGTISILSISKGTVISTIGEDGISEEDLINCFNLSNDGLHLFVHHKSSLFKWWNWKDNKLLKVWKSIHKGPVTCISTSNADIIASGGTDGGVRLWDLQHHACTHNLRGLTGVVSILEFHPNPEKQLLLGAGDDTKIHGWNTETGKEVLMLSGHFSKVTALSFHEDGVHFVSSGRDRVLILWDISLKTSVRVLPVYEGIEGAFIIPSLVPVPISQEHRKDDDILVAAAGEKGVINIWEMRTGKKVYTQENSLVPTAQEEGGLSITHLIYNAVRNECAVVSTDHNIIIHSLENFACVQQLVGYSDEILDVVYLGSGDSHIAVATNSHDIKLYDLSNMYCQLLKGHTDIVLSLGTSPANVHLLVSSAKDNSVRVWLMNEETKIVTCIGSGIRHTASVGSVALSQTSTKFFASVSEDSCMKLWELPATLASTGEDVSLNAVHTVLAHQKGINGVTISPNDKLIATGSQDKTAKLWSADDLQLLGVFRGHRRGVWCVRFSPVDQILLTTSADCTIKIWSLTELNCLKTFEGHESSVMRAEFMSRGMQVITSGGDGLLKVWSVKNSECMCTLEQHESRVWTLAVNKGETHVISGGSDSLLVIWRDVTAEKKAQAAAEIERLALEEQKLANLLQANEYVAALRLSLKLERPFQTLKIVDAILKKGSNELLNAIRDLKPARKETLLKCAVTWNTNSKNCQAAQLVINALITEIGSEDLKISGLTTTLESSIPYTERHFNRLTKLMQDLHILSYSVNCMKPHITSVGVE